MCWGIYMLPSLWPDVIASFTTCVPLFLIKRKALLPDGGAPAKANNPTLIFKRRRLP